MQFYSRYVTVLIVCPVWKTPRGYDISLWSNRPKPFRKNSERTVVRIFPLTVKYIHPAGLTGDHHQWWTGHHGQLITSLSPVVHAILHGKKTCHALMNGFTTVPQCQWFSGKTKTSYECHQLVTSCASWGMSWIRKRMMTTNYKEDSVPFLKINVSPLSSQVMLGFGNPITEYARHRWIFSFLCGSSNSTISGAAAK